MEKSATLALKLSCTILGQLASITEAAFTPGTLVALTAPSGARADFLLCAHIDGDRWLCHSGTLLNCALDPENPFDPLGLVEKDISSCAFEY